MNISSVIFTKTIEVDHNSKIELCTDNRIVKVDGVKVCNFKIIPFTKPAGKFFTRVKEDGTTVFVYK